MSLLPFYASARTSALGAKSAHKAQKPLHPRTYFFRLLFCLWHTLSPQGLLPLDLFVAKLLASPARLLAMEPEQKGPFKSGHDASFRGKILYRYCRKVGRWHLAW